MSRLRIAVSERDHARGPGAAAFTLVEYGDYQCPYCAQAQTKVDALRRAFPGNFRLVYRHFPLTQLHEFAFMAAMSAEAAAEQGKFWEMHEGLYRNQNRLGREAIFELAEQLGLDLERFEDSLVDTALGDKIRKDFMGGVRSGVNGTPTFYINGGRYDGPLEAKILAPLVAA
jgi:protein-disulfide isomerase